MGRRIRRRRLAIGVTAWLAKPGSSLLRGSRDFVRSFSVCHTFVWIAGGQGWWGRSAVGRTARRWLGWSGRAREFFHRVEAPLRPEACEGIVEIRGWCAARAGGEIRGVRLRAGRRVFEGRYGASRADVRPRLGEPGIPERCGYRIGVPVPKVSVRVRLEAQLASGEWRRFCTRRLKVRREMRWAARLREALDARRYRAIARWVERCAGETPRARRLLLVSHELHDTGAPILLMHLATALRGRGFAICVASPRRGRLRRAYLERGIPVFRIDSLLDPGNKNFSHLACFGAILVNTASLGAVVRNAAAAELPTIWYIQDGLSGRSTLMVNPEGRCAYREATAIVFPSHATAALYRDILPRETRVIPNGLPEIPGVARDGGRGATTCGGPTRFLQLGSICHRKGQDILIGALLELDEATRSRGRFDVVGGVLSPRFYDECAARAAPLRTLRWHGPVPHPRALEWLRETDVLIVASRDEALPVVIQEAMSLGKGIIATACGGVPECLTDGADGLVVPVGDRGALATAIRRFLDDPGLAGRLGEAARRTFHERYGLDAMAARFEEIIRCHAKEARPA